VVSPRPRVNKTGFPKTKRPRFSSPYILFVICLWTCLLTWVQTTCGSTCVNFFSGIRTRSKIAESRAKFSQVLVEDSLGLHKISEKLSRNSFFAENPRKNLHWICDKKRQISGQTDGYSPTKRIKQFRTQTNLPFGPGSDE